MSKQWLKNGKRLLIDGVRCLGDECPCVAQIDTLPDVVSMMKKVYQGWDFSTGREVTNWYSAKDKNPENPDDIDKLIFKQGPSYFADPDPNIEPLPNSNMVSIGNEIFNENAEWAIINARLMTGWEWDNGADVLGGTYFYRQGYMLARAMITNNTKDQVKLKITTKTRRYKRIHYRQRHPSTPPPDEVLEDYWLEPIVTITTVQPYSKISMPGVQTGTIEVPELIINYYHVQDENGNYDTYGYFEYHADLTYYEVIVELAKDDDI